jgi:hypothetical protein
MGSTQVRVVETMDPQLTGVATGGQAETDCAARRVLGETQVPLTPSAATPWTGGEADSPLGAQLRSPPGEPPSEMSSSENCVQDHLVISLPPSPPPEQSEQELALCSLQYDELPAQASEQSTLVEMIEQAEAPSGRALSVRPTRRTRRGRDLRPSTHQLRWEEGGEGLTRAACSWNLPLRSYRWWNAQALWRASTAWRRYSWMALDATPALQTSTEQGTTVPVTRAEMAGGGVLPSRWKRRRGKPLAPARVQVLTGQGEIGDDAATLSLRTEFRNRRSRRGVSILSPQAGLGVEITRGQTRKGRQVVLTNELVALHSHPDMRRPPPGTWGIKGVAKGLARQGPVGPLSARIRGNDHSRDFLRNH